MTRPFGWLAPLAAIFSVIAGPAAAQEAAPVEERQYVLSLGGGGAFIPQYPGADRYIFVPFPLAEVGRFYVPIVGQTEGNKQGFFFYPSFGFIGERDPSDDKSLKGTKKIDWAFEAGLGAGFRYDWLRAYATIRQGFNGYDGQVGDLGFEVVVPVGSRFEVAFGPRASWGSEDYMETYFGVTGAEAAKGSLAKYQPDAGFKSAGLSARVSYALTDRTKLHAKAAWDRLIGDAGDSPIVKAGDANQWMIGVGITYKFSFDLFR